MSLRRTERTVESLWRVMQPPTFSSCHGGPHALHARQSPPPHPHYDDLEDQKGHTNGNGYDANNGYEPNGTASAQQQMMLMQPPRLSGPGGCTRLVLALSFFGCFAIVCVAITSAVNHLPARKTITRISNPSPRPLPALLKRFGKLKKATAPERGASRESVNELLAHWADDSPAALRDLALGVSLIAQHLQQPPLVVTVAKPPSPERDSSEDSDL